jgi:hypothetical protein
MKGPKCKLCGQEHFGLCASSRQAVAARVGAIASTSTPAIAKKAEEKREARALGVAGKAKPAKRKAKKAKRKPAPPAAVQP